MDGIQTPKPASDHTILNPLADPKSPLDTDWDGSKSRTPNLTVPNPNLASWRSGNGSRTPNPPQTPLTCAQVLRVTLSALLKAMML